MKTELSDKFFKELELIGNFVNVYNYKILQVKLMACASKELWYLEGSYKGNGLEMTMKNKEGNWGICSCRMSNGLKK